MIHRPPLCERKISHPEPICERRGRCVSCAHGSDDQNKDIMAGGGLQEGVQGEAKQRREQDTDDSTDVVFFPHTACDAARDARNRAPPRARECAPPPRSPPLGEILATSLRCCGGAFPLCARDVVVILRTVQSTMWGHCRVHPPRNYMRRGSAPSCQELPTGGILDPSLYQLPQWSRYQSA